MKNSPSRIYNIYKLINPINKEIFYVGCTQVADLKVRLNQHIYYSTFKITELYLYIKNIIELNEKPIIELIEKTKNKRKELYYIADFSINHKLLNIRISKELLRLIKIKNRKNESRRDICI